MMLSANTMIKMGFELVYTGGGFYTWELKVADGSVMSLEASPIYGRIIVATDSACCRLPSTYSIYDPDGCFIGASDEVVRSAARIRSLASGFSDRLLLMSGAEGRFKELSKLVNNEAQLHHFG
jgi:hypothetical protein